MVETKKITVDQKIIVFFVKNSVLLLLILDVMMEFSLILQREDPSMIIISVSFLNLDPDLQH
jgi:hypothetical protein